MSNVKYYVLKKLAFRNISSVLSSMDILMDQMSLLLFVVRQCAIKSNRLGIFDGGQMEFIFAILATIRQWCVEDTGITLFSGYWSIRQFRQFNRSSGGTNILRMYQRTLIGSVGRICRNFARHFFSALFCDLKK